MRAVDLIRLKRDGGRLERAAIEAFVHGVTSGTWPDYQTSAMLMAIVCRGMTVDETAALTDAMLRSGARLPLGDLPGPKLDKHSTGGVGDKVSLVLAPVLAACGGIVPMMSGRGLGHTAGTLDKLEAVPGYRVELTGEEIRRVLARAGCAIFGQSAEIAPADRRLYALRDVTATVESIPLITGSILSKKLAEGLDGLVLDVKVGRGAFMKTVEDARALAESLVATGRAHGVPTEALMTSMEAPLGRAVGHALEVAEAIDALRGAGPADLEALVLTLAGRLLVVGGLDHDEASALSRARNALASGAALERFRLMVESQGGDPRVVDEPARLPAAPSTRVVVAPARGHLRPLDAEAVARAALALGAGRDRAGAAIDHAVGVRLLAAPGEPVDRGTPVAELHHRDGHGLEEALALLTGAVVVGDPPASPSPLVLMKVA